jgi:hypothetical protein
LFSKLCEVHAVHHVGEQDVFSTTVGEFFDFSVMEEESRLHAGEPPALVRQWAQTYRGMKVPSKSTFQVCTRP